MRFVPMSGLGVMDTRVTALTVASQCGPMACGAGPHVDQLCATHALTTEFLGAAGADRALIHE